MSEKPDLNAKWVSIGSLKEYEKNAKKHSIVQVSKIAQQIKNVGFRVPITVRSKEDLIVVTGHGRLRAAKELGMKEVPVYFLDDLDDNTVKSWRIGDNKVGESSWDDGFLVEEFHDLMEEKVDLSFTGFEDQEIKELLAVPETKKESSKEMDVNSKEMDVKQERFIECPKCNNKFVIKKKT